MTRYASEHKQATRARILQAAGHRLKRDGIDASGVSALMADAGLTNGAFYAHFASKSDLVAHVVAAQLHDQAAALDAMDDTPAAIEEFVRYYLCAAHRDEPGDGCPSAALLDEIGRCDDATRQAYTDGIRTIVEVIARHLDAPDPDVARDRALGAFTMMAGCLQLARAVADPALSDEILERGIRNALTLLGLVS